MAGGVAILQDTKDFLVVGRGRDQFLSSEERPALNPRLLRRGSQCIYDLMDWVVAAIAAEEVRRKGFRATVTDAPVGEDLDRDAQEFSDPTHGQGVPRGKAGEQPISLVRGRWCSLEVACWGFLRVRHGIWTLNRKMGDGEIGALLKNAISDKRNDAF